MRPRGLSLSGLIFWVQSRLVANGDCLEWRGGCNSDGYGHLQFEGKMLKLHRLLCMVAHGAPPSSRPLAIHSCDNRRCCNPKHLRWGSAADNNRDCVEHGRHQRRPWSGARRGAGNPHAKTTEEDVRRIRRAAEAGVPTAELAVGFGLAERTIRNIVTRTRWAHVD